MSNGVEQTGDQASGPTGFQPATDDVSTSGAGRATSPSTGGAPASPRDAKPKGENRPKLIARALAFLSAWKKGEPEGGPSAGVAATPLQSLTPRFEEEHHRTYLRRLEEAVRDPGNLNIALTGRYGAGKSSVLDQFEANHRRTTQRLTISTLAPGEEGESTTNRIQKEVVKQLVYGASQKVGKGSRFTKIAVLSKPRALGQAAVLVVGVGALLYLFGWLPNVKWTGPEETTWVRWAAWAGAAALAALVVGSVRLVTYGRFLSDVSAAGAGLTLSEKPESFFDKYLDEIVHYFDRESKDIVIFEDLDRFEDPRIFEALRELNVLLNATPRRHGGATRWLPRWAARLRGQGVPLRFIYAVRDSVFESIGTSAAGTPAENVDVAAAETLRANRTKFFDIVIPLVPFISHRNARDLLIKLLEERGIEGVDARLVNTIARHCTDMRLMRNMCNEYLVFAERLLEPQGTMKPAPGMDPSRLFALVAYKNFHLEDFENITRRDSDLDRLYEYHRRMVREASTALDEGKRQLLDESDLVGTRADIASMLGARLMTFAEAVRSPSGLTNYSFAFKVGSTDFDQSAVTGYRFWAAVAQHRSVAISAGRHLTRLDDSALESFAPEASDAHRWAEYDEISAQSALADIEVTIETLRRADFVDLIDMPQFSLAAVPAHATKEAAVASQTFDELVATTLQSDLACDLVRRGYIDRNFSLYAAQFYGHFIGVEVANFMVQHVQTNTMDVAYDLGKAGYVANLLTEAEDAGEELLGSVAAYNIDIVNHLLVTDHGGAAVVVKQLIASGPGEDARAFLAAYFTSGKSERTRLAALLTEHGWRDVFTYLVSDRNVPRTARAALVSAAMCAYDENTAYEFDDRSRDFIRSRYGSMLAFAAPTADGGTGDSTVPGRVFAVLERARVDLPVLSKVGDPSLRKLIVEGNRYALTADNLRTALDVRGSVSLDHVKDDSIVYAYCIEQLPAYLAAVTSDPATEHAVDSPEVLVKVLGDLTADWEEDEAANPQSGEVAELLAHTSPDACLTDLRRAPRSTWAALAATGLFRATLANVEEYRTHAGGAVDAHLASLLKRAACVHVDTVDVTDPDGNEYNRTAAAVAILNTEAGLTNEERVQLAASLDAPHPLPAEEITWAAKDLFALLIERDLVNDDAATFDRIRLGGWAALGPAIAVSDSIATFITPALVEGMVGELLTNRSAMAKVGHLVVEDIDSYVPEDDGPALNAAAVFAHTHSVPLTPETVARIARAQRSNGVIDTDVILRLLCGTSPSPTADKIVEVFTHLGSPYSQISQAGEKFKVDRDDVHDQLLKVLKAANRISRGISHGTPLSRSQYTVTVL